MIVQSLELAEKYAHLGLNKACRIIKIPLTIVLIPFTLSFIAGFSLGQYLAASHRKATVFKQQDTAKPAPHESAARKSETCSAPVLHAPANTAPGMQLYEAYAKFQQRPQVSTQSQPVTPGTYALMAEAYLPHTS